MSYWVITPRRVTCSVHEPDCTTNEDFLQCIHKFLGLYTSSPEQEMNKLNINISFHNHLVLTDFSSEHHWIQVQFFTCNRALLFHLQENYSGVVYWQVENGTIFWTSVRNTCYSRAEILVNKCKRVDFVYCQILNILVSHNTNKVLPRYQIGTSIFTGWLFLKWKFN